MLLEQTKLILKEVNIQLLLSSLLPIITMLFFFSADEYDPTLQNATGTNKVDFERGEHTIIIIQSSSNYSNAVFFVFFFQLMNTTLLFKMLLEQTKLILKEVNIQLLSEDQPQLR